MSFFIPEDFELFAHCGEQKRAECPEDTFDRLKENYKKLGVIADEITKDPRFKSEIIRNPLKQDGKTFFDYNWARIYPQDLYEDCKDKAFFIIGMTKAGFDIHIDNRWTKDYQATTLSKRIKDHTFKKYSVEEMCTKSLDEIVELFYTYYEENEKDYYKYGSELGVEVCTKRYQAMQMTSYIKLLQENQNLILTGAPGTGKTYLAKEIAQQLILGASRSKGSLTSAKKAKLAEQCEFVQFHPSYDYTDFVEGLRPKDLGNGNIGFERKDGVFKEFCKKAYLAPSRGLAWFKKNHPSTLLSIRAQKPFSIRVNNQDKIVVTPQGGQDYLVVEAKIEQYLRDRSYDPSTDTYEPTIGDYILRNYSCSGPFVFIIDEINRGEIAKIFGELFFAVDPGYRGERGCIKTQYQNMINKADPFSQGFYIPMNVYIIGTMNDIDRSVENMDFAIRRRFAWKEVSVDERLGMLDTLGSSKDMAVKKMKAINDKLLELGFSSAYNIGPAYFLKLSSYGGDFQKLWKYHLEGVLFEYLRGLPDSVEKLKALQSAYNQ